MIQSRLISRIVLLLVAPAAVPLLWTPAMAQSSEDAMMQVGLDLAGRPDEAQAVWERMLRLAEEINDAPVAEHVRARLAQQEPLTQAAMMQAGLDLLYVRRDPAEAAAQFRKVLARNPTHYGATLQLAKSLDGAGQAPEARAVWEQVLTMAALYTDAETTATAEARLATRP